MERSVNQAMCRQRRYFPAPEDLSNLEELVELGASYDDASDQMFIAEWVDPLPFIRFFPARAIPVVTDLAVKSQSNNVVEVVFNWSWKELATAAQTDSKLTLSTTGKTSLKPIDARRIYLECPYSEKDLCKALGGRWDPKARQWFIPAGSNSQLFSRWLNAGASHYG
jgi:hypothetical protein